MYELITSTLFNGRIEIEPQFFQTFKKALKEAIRDIRGRIGLELIDESINFFRESRIDVGLDEGQIEELLEEYAEEMPIHDVFLSTEDREYMQKLYKHIFINDFENSHRIMYNGNSFWFEKTPNHHEDEEIFSIAVLGVPEDTDLVRRLKEENDELRAILSHKLYEPGNIGSTESRKSFEKFLSCDYGKK